MAANGRARPSQFEVDRTEIEADAGQIEFASRIAIVFHIFDSFVEVSMNFHAFEQRGGIPGRKLGESMSKANQGCSEVAHCRHALVVKRQGRSL